MAGGFKFDAREFERNLKKAIEKPVNDHMRKVGAALQRALDSVHQSHAGKPVPEVKAALNTELRRADFTPEGGELDSWAEAISNGTKIDVRVDRFRP